MVISESKNQTRRKLIEKKGIQKGWHHRGKAWHTSDFELPTCYAVRKTLSPILAKYVSPESNDEESID